MSEVEIGLTIVVAGTSRPEVAPSVVAAQRGERDIAVGHAVGSPCPTAIQSRGWICRMTKALADGMVEQSTMMVMATSLVDHVPSPGEQQDWNAQLMDVQGSLASFDQWGSSPQVFRHRDRRPLRSGLTTMALRDGARVYWGNPSRSRIREGSKPKRSAISWGGVVWRKRPHMTAKAARAGVKAMS